ncbi:SDR family oxidoreductase [Ruminococcaceae bacterium OttesenSCG-928-D13]|nr:SDR family oxidoreductase [Ruminococcaceae bacterium OttesenSCG-928-D13]
MKKTAVVTGAGAGIGQGIALALAQKGCKVYANARSAQKLKKTLELCKDYDVEPLVFDVTKEDEVKAALLGLATVDVLVNNAGVGIYKPYEEIDAADWDLVLNTNVKGYFFVTKYALERMARGGSIINLSSGAAKTGGEFVSLPYSSSKGAINALTISYARMLAPQGIRVNAVSPGFVDTSMLTHNNKPKEYYDGVIPLGRLGLPKDIANMVAFLASEEADFITGQIIEVNGGDIMG